MNDPFSSLSRRERYWAYIAISVIMAVFLGFAVRVVMLIHERNQQSTGPAAQNPVAPASANNAGNLVNPPDVWNSPAGGSTNTTSAMPNSQNSQTNSN